MKKILLLLSICILASACHQLDPGKTIDIDEGDDATTEFHVCEVGDSYNFELYNSREKSLNLELSGLTSEGMYSLHFIPRSSDSYYNDIIIQLYDSLSCLGYGDYVICCNDYRNEDGDHCYEYLFQLHDTETKYAKIFIDDNYVETLVFTISFQFNHIPFDDPFIDNFSKREISLDEPVTGCFSRLSTYTIDYFTVSGLNHNSIYMVSIDYDYSDLVFHLEESKIPRFYAYSPYVFITNFKTRYRDFFFFSLSEGNTFDFQIEGYTGISYHLLVQEELETFTPDTFEPDNGPISDTMEIISDTGWDFYEGQSHTFTCAETDWISFTPEADSSYIIYIILEDTWYDEGTADGFSLRLEGELIRQNGYERETHRYFSFTQIPKTPVKSSSYLTLGNSGDSPDPWFIKIINKESSICLEYSIRIEKRET
jgi:hypothetical protein